MKKITNSKLPWHAVYQLFPMEIHEIAVRELYLLAIVIERDWSKDYPELLQISNQLRHTATALDRIFVSRRGKRPTHKKNDKLIQIHKRFRELRKREK